MPTRLSIDDDLLAEAFRLGGQLTMEDTLHQALREYIERRKQTGIINLFGTIEMGTAEDHKTQRRR